MLVLAIRIDRLSMRYSYPLQERGRLTPLSTAVNTGCNYLNPARRERKSFLKNNFHESCDSIFNLL